MPMDSSLLPDFRELAAAHLGTLMGRANLLSFDMGGTTAKACLIERGRPSIGNELEVARLQRFKKGSGLPIKISSVDLIETGAGGNADADPVGFEFLCARKCRERQLGFGERHELGERSG